MSPTDDEIRANMLLEVAMAMRMHQVQFDRANRLENERDAALATATRWEQRAHDLETLARAAAVAPTEEPTP